MTTPIRLLCVLLLLAVNMSAQSGNIGVGTNTPTSRLHISGSIAIGYRIVSSSTALDANDYTIEFNGSTAASISLPDATTCKGRIYYIKNTSTTLPTPMVTISPQSAQTIDGKTSWTMNKPNHVMNIVSNGTNWQIYAQEIPVVISDSTGETWLAGGNVNTPAVTKKLGTITNNDIPIITNNIERMRITNTGSVGIGTAIFDTINPEKLIVNGILRMGTTSATTGSILFSNSTNSNSITINSGVTSASYSLTLPTAQGASSTVLTNNGTGVLSWSAVGAPSGTWLTTGNSGTSPSTNFIGTTDNQSLVFKANNQIAGKIDLSLNNAIFGYQSASSITSGNNSTFMGYQAGYSNTSGPSNTALGCIALFANTSGSNNTAVGQASLTHNTTGAQNTAIGTGSMRFNTTGASNSGISNSALYSNTTGNYNTAAGMQSLNSNTTNSNNSAFGYQSLYNSTGADNIGVGYKAGYTITTGAKNILIGSNADVSSASFTEAVAIGYNAIVGASNAMVLGGTGADAMQVGCNTTTPNSRFQVAGSFATTCMTTSSNYTLTINESVVSVNASGGSITITLPSAVGINGRQYTIKKNDSSANGVSIQANGAQTIDGANTVALSNQWKYAKVTSDGANWLITANN